MGYGLGAKAVKASIDKRNAQRELWRQQQANQPTVVKKPESQRAINREYAVFHYHMEKQARAIWWGLNTKRLEGILRKPWRLST
jgi:hypothetical protein